MKAELEKKLREKYPSLFRDLDRPHQYRVLTPLAFGLEVGNGWYGILDDLFAKLSVGESVHLAQVKEKFGGLRVYTNGCTKEQNDMIGEAMRLSQVTCEVCGAAGVIRETSWMVTLCDKCKELQDAKRNAGLIEAVKYFTKLFS